MSHPGQLSLAIPQCTCVCVCTVVSQALLQAHDPDIQAKLLAMQRQMQLSGAPIPTDAAPAGGPSTAGSGGRSLLAPDAPVFVSTARHSKVMNTEQKEEQTRQVVDAFLMLTTYLI